MNVVSATDHLKNELKDLTETFHRDRQRHKGRALRLKVATAVFAALATVALGLKGLSQNGTEWLSNVALVLNALITVLAAYEVFYEPRRLWIRETVVLNRLRDVERALQWDLAKSLDVSTDRLDQYQGQISDILKESLKEWQEQKAKGS